jgi:hypothetical protein
LVKWNIQNRLQHLHLPELALPVNSYLKTSALRELSGANDGKAAVPDYLEATVYNKAGKDKILLQLLLRKEKYCFLNMEPVLRIRILDPGSGIDFFRIPDLGSKIPNPYF